MAAASPMTAGDTMGQGPYRWRGTVSITNDRFTAVFIVKKNGFNLLFLF
jgi:hypothetical protein